MKRKGAQGIDEINNKQSVDLNQMIKIILL